MTMTNIQKIEELKDLDCKPSTKMKKFKMLYRGLINQILEGTNYSIVGWKNKKDYVSFYVKDEYTNRLMYVKVPDFHVDNEAWKNKLELRTVNKLYSYPGPIANYCKLDRLIYSLNNLNVFYERGSIPYMFI